MSKTWDPEESALRKHGNQQCVFPFIVSKVYYFILQYGEEYIVSFYFVQPLKTLKCSLNCLGLT